MNEKSPAISRFFETSDHAKLFYTDQGSGEPLLLIHGWCCSSDFWRANAPVLAEQYRVITLDLRGHGNSSKILTGHSIHQYARDIRDLMEHLDLRQVCLAGWSLSGPVLLSFWQQFGREGRLKAIGLIDFTAAPFSPEPWNSHGMKGSNLEAMHGTFAAYTANPSAFAAAFTHKMFGKEQAPEMDLRWIVAELTKTPPWIAVAIYSDYLISDFTPVLATIDIPVIVFAGNSGIFKRGIEQGRHLASLAPLSHFVPFEDAGHLLFYEQPDKFNAELAGFLSKIQS